MFSFKAMTSKVHFKSELRHLAGSAPMEKSDVRRTVSKIIEIPYKPNNSAKGQNHGSNRFQKELILST